MTSSRASERRARFEVANVGGIDEATVTIPSGVTVLSGENATNRTSFLQAIMAAMGSDEASLKGDADRGSVRLELDGETYERELVREDGHVHARGDGYLSDPTVADLFAFLLETNEARQAVALGGDLRAIVMRPVDVEEIRAEIDRLEDEKDGVNDELADLESLKAELPDLERERRSLDEEIDELRDELAGKEAEIEDHDASVEETRDERDRLESKLGELRDTRNDLQSVRYEIESATESIESLERERAELRDELDDLPEAPAADVDVEDEIDRLRDRKNRLEREVRELQSAIQFNEEMLAGDGDGLLDDLAEDGGTVTDRLVDDEVVCWTCGSSVTAEDVESTLASLRSVRTEKLATTDDLDDRLEELQAERRRAERQRRERERLESRLDEVETELDRRRERRADLRERKSALTDEVEDLEDAVERLESESFEEVLDLHREANELEFELDRLEGEREDVEARIEEVEAAVAREDDLRERREALLDDLEECRTRIDRIEADAVEQFNTHADAILDVLEYDNLDRIWIERRTETVREGRGTVERSVFDLHVVRSTPSGTAYEDTVDHLSESEREVTGLVFALAGYLVHDVHETVPFVLLDSLEAIDSDRIAALVDYFADFAPFLVVALLPEDAQALDDEYARVTEI